jgi:hypothetical protein
VSFALFEEWKKRRADENSPTNQSAFDSIVLASQALIQSFNESSSPPGFVQFTGTNEVVQDYEMIRAALGYEKINFLGLS